jgi:hypothetical protein
VAALLRWSHLSRPSPERLSDTTQRAAWYLGVSGNNGARRPETGRTRARLRRHLAVRFLRRDKQHVACYPLSRLPSLPFQDVHPDRFCARTWAERFITFLVQSSNNDRSRTIPVLPRLLQNMCRSPLVWSLSRTAASERSAVQGLRISCPCLCLFTGGTMHMLRSV